MIQFAHDLRSFEVVGGPAWIREDEYEINARAAAEITAEEQRPMVRALLEDRFRLVVRRDQRDMRFAALVLARSDGRVGPKLTACGDTTVPAKPLLVPRGARMSVLHCGPIVAIANLATNLLEMPVIDETGLVGDWSHELFFADLNGVVGNTSAVQSAVDPTLSSFPTALQEQLGLKLETRRGPINVLVVESIRRPSED